MQLALVLHIVDESIIVSVSAIGIVLHRLGVIRIRLVDLIIIFGDIGIVIHRLG